MTDLQMGLVQEQISNGDGKIVPCMTFVLQKQNSHTQLEGRTV